MIAIVWFRNDLRVHDLPALAAAADEADQIIPLFIADPLLLDGPTSSKNRNGFLAESLADLDASLRERGGRLVISHGTAVEVLKRMVTEHQVGAVYASADITPYAARRDAAVGAMLKEQGVELRLYPGRLAVDTLDTIKTKSDTVHKVFTPFWKVWQQEPRRAVVEAPRQISVPDSAPQASPLDVRQLGKGEPSPRRLGGGEAKARARLRDFLSGAIHEYTATHNDLSLDGTSRLSSYLHFGCLSPREIETMLPDSPGAAAWHRQLAWREFYHYILHHFPTTPKQEFQERYHDFPWAYDESLLQAWQTGKTGYPVVDAAMRQLAEEGWMHNRARLIVGSFLTKDLLLDWRLGEAHFMRMLIDGDTANNVGNWQWIASMGVDPAPVFRRLYNPTSQQASYDPTGAYVRRYVPELRNVPDELLAEPWRMTVDQQRDYGVVIGQDYPSPIVDHAAARVRALDAYRSAQP